MSAQFGVDPETLQDLAGRFDTEAKELGKHIQEFTASSSEVGQAFGLLGACDGALAKYQQLMQHTATALSRLPQVLNSDGSRLRLNAENYKATDQATNHHLQAMTRP
ncbi:type VII secretion target [Streptomyces caniferus]|uniref:Type VII secretion target n=1 Tax=Streptomyces caniferus TaxID=285557 RepID=A0A640SIY8_9ACTN|nr:type VII secretion target [Streptomyces caniferus]GFE10804.1 hypothetical protein Scani_70720 [Streptomyces caniferus]